MGSCIAIGPGIEEVEPCPCPCQGAPRAVFPDAKTSENRKNTEFRTILEMGLREAYPGRVVADPAYEALKDTHTEHPVALGFNRGWRVR